MSPDGRKIAFVVDRHGHPAAIYVMNQDGTGIQRMTPWYSSIAFAWLSDESIAFWGSGYVFSRFNIELLSKYGNTYVKDLNNGNVQKLTNPPIELLVGKFVCLSTYGVVVKDLLEELGKNNAEIIEKINKISDDDRDGISNWDEMNKYKTNPNNPDTDGGWFTRQG